MIYFICTHDDKQVYTDIFDLSKKIFKFFGIKYIEGIESETSNDFSEKLTEYGIQFTFPKYEKYEGLCNYYQLMILRWYYPIKSKLLKDNDRIIIFDADMIFPRPDLYISKLESEYKDGYINTQYGYCKVPRNRFRSVPQYISVKTLKEFFGNMSFNEVLEDSISLRNSRFPTTKNLIEETYIGTTAYRRGMINFTDWDPVFHQYTVKKILGGSNDDSELISQFPIKDFTEIHGYADPGNDHIEYLRRLQLLLNNYYRSQNLNLIL